jgi:hypothetical protein
MRKAVLAGLVVALLLPVVPAVAQDDDQRAKLDAIAKLGKEINDHDQAAWHVTDALVAAKLPGLGQASFGFFTERVDAETVRAGFVEYVGDDYRVIFTGLVKGSTVESTQNLVDVRPPATQQQVVMIKGQRAIAERYPQGLCGARPNLVMLPSKDVEGEFDAYILAPETMHGVMQIGGHERTRIDAEGRIAGEVTPYNAGCMSAQMGSNAEMIVTMLRPDVEQAPTEMHVFKSLSHDIPIFVVGKEASFIVSDGGIQAVPTPAHE